MQAMDVIEQEELYQNFRIFIDQTEPEQRESYLNLFKTFCRLPKKKINMLGSFVERYRQEDHTGGCSGCQDNIENLEALAIYSILEKLATRKWIRVEHRDLCKELGPGYLCRYTFQDNESVIGLDEDLSGEKLNQELAHALGYSQIMVDESYSNMIACKDKTKVERLNKQARNFAIMLIEGIRAGLAVAR